MEDFKKNGKWRKQKKIDGVIYRTKSGSVYSNMRTRCRTGGAYQKKFPSYQGCMLSPEFATFQGFTEWHVKQIGYGLDGYQLDKDLLGKGSKVYSPETCVLIPEALNSFFTDPARSRCEHGRGVRFSFGTFKAQIREDNKNVIIGTYATAEEARAAYKQAKEVQARKWADRLEAGEYVVDPRVIVALREWTINN